MVEAESGAATSLFETLHVEKDVLNFRDGQITQQRLEEGVVVESGAEIVIDLANSSNSDIPFNIDGFCSAYVQLFGEELSQ